jgi:hypothetical protein
MYFQPAMLSICDGFIRMWPHHGSGSICNYMFPGTQLKFNLEVLLGILDTRM